MTTLEWLQDVCAGVVLLAFVTVTIVLLCLAGGVL